MTRGRPSVVRWLASTLAVMTVVTAASGAVASAAPDGADATETDRPVLAPAAYPSTGPTTTTTLPVPVDPSPYPTTPPPTTTVPPTTHPTSNPQPGTTPTTTPPVVTTPPTPRPVPEPTTPTTTLPTQSLVRYGLAEEHRPFSLDVSYEDATSYVLASARDGVTVTSAGLLHWTPDEDDGGTAVNLMVIARGGGESVTIEVRILVAETNRAPVIDARGPIYAYPGQTTQFRVTAHDPDQVDDAPVSGWTIVGPDDITIADGIVTWAVPADHAPGIVEVVVSITDDGDPPLETSRTFTLEVVDVSEAALMAVDDDGAPVNPLVIAAASPGAAPVLVDLEQPAALVASLAENTPAAAVELPSEVIDPVTTPLERSAVVTSVSQTLGVLLELDVPTTAVASGLAWQFVLMAAPGLLSRRRDLFDVDGLAPDAMIGDGRWFFRSDAIALRGGGLRWREGRWMRRVASPVGPVGLPAAHLRRSHRNSSL